MIDLLDSVFLSLCVGTFVVVAILVACGVIHGDHNKDPRKGSVEVSDTVTKKCSGDNLVFTTEGGLFSDGSVSIVAHSAECK